MNIVVRADASLQIGTGHVMRCLTLADELRARGASIRFVCRQLIESLATLIRAHGHTLSMLPSAKAGTAEHGQNEPAYAHWLGVGWERDAQDTLAGLADTAGWDWVIVDHYGIDERWETMLRRTLDSKIMVIDDIADRQHDCDVLLDQNFYADMNTRYTGKVPSHCQLLLGPRYALLRDEFRQLREQVKPRTGLVKRVLVFFGGMDSGNYTALAIEALAGSTGRDLRVDVVIGAQHPHSEQIESACAEHGFVCHVQTERMAELMAAADLAIGAGGSASWERCCLGLPSIVGAVAQNQVQAAKDFSAFGTIKYVGAVQEVTVEKLRHEIEQANYQDWIEKASLLGLGLVDAQGVMRVIEMMEKI